MVNERKALATKYFYRRKIKIFIKQLLKRGGKFVNFGGHSIY